ncbi:MAG: four-carbon acid sugar kinase family protein [Gorillibacterium sp.]|nr:four-carbon acid sugar kinase family protein [Gorillibacterium sp.]
MSRFAFILADDVTGANDTGIQFFEAGFPTQVWNEIDESLFLRLDGSARNGGNSVVVFHTNTRAMTQAEAVDKLRADVKRIPLDKYAYIYKKIDSTMRGHVVSEIEVMMETGVFDAAVIVPAYPENGRRTIGGYHLVGTALLEDSAAAKDPHFPISESHLLRWIQKQTIRRTDHLELETIRSDDCFATVNELLNKGTELLVCDSATTSDMSRIFKAASSSGKRILWVGSAGLASVIARFEREKREAEAPLRSELPVLVIAGSVHPVTRDQLAALAKAGYEIIDIDPVALLERSEVYGDMIINRAAETICRGLSVGYVITTVHSDNKRLELAEKAKIEGFTPLQTSSRIASEIGRITQGCIARCCLAGVILTGGDIAMHAFKHIKASQLDIIGKAEEGIPLCMIHGEVEPDLLFATKSGGFGNNLSLFNTARIMKEYQRRSH